MIFDPATPAFYLAPGYRPLAAAARPVIDPATLEEVGRIAETTEEEAEAVLRAVNAAQAGWKRLDAKSRARALHDLANRIEAADHRPAAILMSREMGKPYPEAIGEIANCAPIFRYYAEMARDEAGKVAGTTQEGSFQHARYEPYGVSVHIMPFNFPVLLMCWTVAASLAAGNGCVIKPAPATTLSTLEFMKHFNGLPEGLVACLPGGAALAEGLIASPRTHAVAFTGSVAAGRAVGAAAADAMKPAVIEAGGSDPMIVCESAPLDVAAAGAVTAAFHLTGQVCTSAERFYVVDAVHDAFVAEFARITRGLRIGNGLGRSEIGPLVSEAARAKVMRLVDDARARGASVVTGGRIPPGLPKGWFYEPTILTGCTDEMEILRTECFGPVASVVRVRDFDEAVARANASPFGLGASVFTTRLDEAMEAADRLEAGMVWVNNPLIDNDALPFGGWKASGLGRELGRQGLDAFRRSKMVIIDHKPQIQAWWYPYPDDWFLDAGGRKAH
ncbi:MAG: aldehyde dehydrogenase [Rhodobacteraceae bacterium]|uniref:aldehyde dehydrogenase family protein n=1 Tax=Albidovulum sp. TaxID=1872424 RepID=UPI001E11E87E|nr:aldehyde dehydrogenase [Paracoccaceae bacterium]HPE26469.1 aldehyde dehydrogenase family protein [Albidovulum sp.]MCB2143762.1 aldehyde dehydrogenase [Paracoccaceae bacterium]MCB2152871.1 aldehyde dehydrogenase [Paracoccaceae bacterium]MCB2160071.1 aldehyde dehydrogenase [Paracoccaceae bacterium]